MSNIAVKWSGEGSKMFVGRDSYGHIVVAGSWSDDDPDFQEWKAIKPSDLLLIGLASCTAHDVVMILERQKQQLSALHIDVKGDQLPHPPHAFTDIHVYYTLNGVNLDRKKVARAITLSLDRYCSVAATIKGVATISHSFKLVGLEDDATGVQSS